MNNIDLVCTETLDALPPYGDPIVLSNQPTSALPDPQPSMPNIYSNTAPPTPNLNFPGHPTPTADKIDPAAHSLSSPMTWSSASPDQSGLTAPSTTVIEAHSSGPEPHFAHPYIVSDDDESDVEAILNPGSLPPDHPFATPADDINYQVNPDPNPNPTVNDAPQPATAEAALNFITPIPSALCPPGSSDSAHVLAGLCARDANYAVPRRDHLRNTGITPAMRCEVVNWFTDLVNDLSMPEAAVAIATNVFDRFLASCRLDPILIYAISSACFLIACKVVLDEEVSNYEVAERTRVSLEHLNQMEFLILTELDWAVNVVSPHEVLAEVDHLIHLDSTEMARLRQLQSTLVMAAMVDYELSHLHATSVAVACHVLSVIVLTDMPVDQFDRLPVYLLGSAAGVRMAEVDFCLTRLRNTLATMLGFIEDCDTDVSMDESTGGGDYEDAPAPIAGM